MRVAIVQETIDGSRGGAEKSTVEMARQLALLDLDVTLVHRLDSQHDTASACEAGVKFHPIPVKGNKLAKSRLFLRLADDYCIRENFGIVHAVSPCFSANVYQPRGGTFRETVTRNVAIERSWLKKCIKVIDRRFNQKQRFLMQAEDAMLAGPRLHVAAVSDYVRRQVTKGFGVAGERVRVVFNGVDIEPLNEADARTARQQLRSENGISDDTPLVLFVGHNFKLKGLRELILTMAALVKHANKQGGIAPKLIVAGGGRESTYQKLVEQYGLVDSVVFLQSQSDIRRCFAAADCLSHPTWYDPCSRVVLEAISCGLPVVTTRWNGASEIIEDGVHGVVIDSPENLTALAVGIGRCCADDVKSACQSAAPAIREWVSMRRHARELKAFYESIVQK